MNIPEEINTSLCAIISFIGDKYFNEENIHLFVKRKAILSGKKLYIHEQSLPPGKSGFTLSLSDSYVVCINSEIDDLRKLTTKLHEYAHIILDHLKPSPYSYNDFISAISCKDNILNHEPSSSYDSPHEYSAELFAMILLDKINLSKESTPTLIQYMYGYKRF